MQAKRSPATAEAPERTVDGLGQTLRAINDGLLEAHNLIEGLGIAYKKRPTGAEGWSLQGFTADALLVVKEMAYEILSLRFKVLGGTEDDQSELWQAVGGDALEG